MITFIAAIVILGGLIFCHELGHFLAARMLGMGVKAFSLGFGPRLVGITSGNTDYRISAFPLGGYVQLAGESGDPEEDKRFPEHELFSSRPPWQRMLVVAAGPFFNFVLAFVCYWALFLASGQVVLAPTVGQVIPGSPAMEAGFQPGDKIEDINGLPVHFWDDMVDEIRKEDPRPLNIIVLRGEQRLTMTLTPRLEVHKTIFGEEIRLPTIGLVPSGERLTVPVEGIGLTAALQQTWYTTKMTIMGFVKLIERIIPLETLGGPIFLVQAIHESAQVGLISLISLTAVISINLGIINLLPIPVLDGGHLLFFFLEMVRGRPVNERWHALATRIGLMFLLVIMALAIFNDIRR
ncbi:RIP metalloprotease RseP [Salidesulfovibrio onnuriiensis]|uniref:RIP metalloprotease RseP n=1 Tax=Salidesulfovibrio onnuriiensis TaxID=2583823 RepID=UPI0011CAB3B7|nr:RIP metalloprotease RseP [Salidesulfovibrio onnuriiensis]